MTGKEGSCSTPAEEGSCSTGAKGDGKPGCCGKVLAGALAGGIVTFAWLSLSWMALPWHKESLLSFKDEKAVAAVISENISGDGVYVIPFTNMGKEEQKTQKPFAFVSARADGIDIKSAMSASMGKDFLLCLVLAGLLSCFLSKKGPGCPMALSMQLGLLAGLSASMPNYIWFHFPLGYALTGLADVVIAFTLAGFVLSKFVFRTKSGCGMKTSCGTKVIDKTEDK